MFSSCCQCVWGENTVLCVQLLFLCGKLRWVWQNYALECMKKLPRQGFEPRTFCLPCRRSTNWLFHTFQYITFKSSTLLTPLTFATLWTIDNSSTDRYNNNLTIQKFYQLDNWIKCIDLAHFILIIIYQQRNHKMCLHLLLSSNDCFNYSVAGDFLSMMTSSLWVWRENGWYVRKTGYLLATCTVDD